MARYIDANALYEKIYPLDLADKRRYAINAQVVADAINNAPTADVVPRDEYEALRINLKAMRYELRSLKTRYEELHYKYQIAASDGYNKLIVELKEKHTKGGEGK